MRPNISPGWSTEAARPALTLPNRKKPCSSFSSGAFGGSVPRTKVHMGKPRIVLAGPGVVGPQPKLGLSSWWTSSRGEGDVSSRASAARRCLLLAHGRNRVRLLGPRKAARRRHRAQSRGARAAFPRSHHRRSARRRRVRRCRRAALRPAAAGGAHPLAGGGALRCGRLRDAVLCLRIRSRRARSAARPAALLFRLHGFGFAIAIFLFGLYCVLVGVLILRSTFLPHAIGALMSLGGLGYIVQTLAGFAGAALGPVPAGAVTALGGIGEGALLVWLIVRGVDAERWLASAKA